MTMTPQATLEKMQKMKLAGMASAFAATFKTGFAGNLTADELLAHLIDAEWDERYNRRLSRLLKTAGFRYQASFEHIHFHPHRNLDKNLILRLSTCDWITKGENVLLTGATGVGKSFLACALGHQACLLGFKVIYASVMKLFTKLKFAKADGSYTKELSNLQNQNLLILDDFGLHPMDEQSKLILLELLEDRYGQQATLITSQFPTGKWYDLIANSTLADAICDRLIHNSCQIELKGESMRIKSKSNSG
jgi:DNA replication protein DnaC